MTMITPSYLGETIEYSSLHACRSTLEDPTFQADPAWHKARDHSEKDGPIIANIKSSLLRPTAFSSVK